MRQSLQVASADLPWLVGDGDEWGLRLPLGTDVTAPTEWRDCDDIPVIEEWNVACESTINGSLCVHVRGGYV